jgi:hypothetical protein
MHILQHERGPEITAYLGKNLGELQAVSQMSPMQAAVYIETQLLEKAKRPGPKVPPAPTENIGGKPFPAGDDGITME